MTTRMTDAELAACWDAVLLPLAPILTPPMSDGLNKLIVELDRLRAAEAGYTGTPTKRGWYLVRYREGYEVAEWHDGYWAIYNGVGRCEDEIARWWPLPPMEDEP